MTATHGTASFRCPASFDGARRRWPGQCSRIHILEHVEPSRGFAAGSIVIDKAPEKDSRFAAVVISLDVT